LPLGSIWGQEAIMVPVHPPKMVFDARGELIEVIVSAEDFRVYVSAVLSDTPWDELPEHWQDAVDRLMIEDVLDERGDAVDLDSLVGDVGR
jgi:hypothetical protein